MSTAHAQADLNPALRRVLALVPEGAQRERFHALFAAAARAVDALVELDLSAHEREDGPDGDLAVWEAVAPLVLDTVVQVNEVLSLVRDQFPATPSPGALEPDAAFDDLFGEAAPRPSRPEPDDPDRPVREAVAAIRAIAEALALDVTSFGEGLRRPTIAGSRFQLLGHLNEYRGKFRAGIAEMIHLAATAFAQVRKEDVVAGYQEDVEAAVTVRRTVTMLATAVRAENDRLPHLSGDELRAAVRRVADDLDTFGRTAAYALLRVQDKISIRKARSGLESALGQGATEAGVRQLVEGLDKFLGSLSIINRREILIVHDREMIVVVTSHLEHAAAALREGRLERARSELQGAHRAAQRLFGRDQRLDLFLGRTRRFDAATFGADQIRAATAELAAAIAGVSTS